MKANGKYEEKFRDVDDFLSGYQEEEVPENLQRQILMQARLSKNVSLVSKIEAKWKRLSLVASVAAFLVGIAMSNPVFADSSSTETASLNFGESSLYSYVMEGN